MLSRGRRDVQTCLIGIGACQVDSERDNWGMAKKSASRNRVLDDRLWDDHGREWRRTQDLNRAIQGGVGRCGVRDAE